jgi:protocatechuate 4,5-dioxygenase beta chain
MWAPLFDGYPPVREWLESLRPDAFIVVYNDHMNRFFFDAYPTFALGVADVYPQADEGWGKRNLPDMRGDAAFSWHVARSLMEDEFDPTICQDMSVDHGVMSFMPMLTDTSWPVPIVPLAVNVIQHPLPTARRLYKLGAALRHAVESYKPDFRVVIMGTGGLSHQLQGARFGFTDPDWDNRFMDQLESEPEALAALSHRDYM